MTLEEQVAHYAAVRKRIANAPSKFRPLPVVLMEPEPKPEPVRVIVEPKWPKIPDHCFSKHRKVAAHICERRGVDLRAVFGPARKQALSEARAEIYWHLRRLEWSLSEIARRFDVDHTSVLAGIKRFQRGIDDGKYTPCILPPDLEALATPPERPNAR